MKLRATIQRKQARGFMPAAVIVTHHPAGSSYSAAVEHAVERNIGPRPWSEASYWKNGHLVVIYSK